MTTFQMLLILTPAFVLGVLCGLAMRYEEVKNLREEHSRKLITAGNEVQTFLEKHVPFYE